ILLYIYSLTDKRLIAALEKKRDEGVEVTVFYDPSATKKAVGFALSMRGLMHRKLLVIDKRAVYIGSANWTPYSLRMHDNLVVGVQNEELAETIGLGNLHSHFTLAGQLAEFWMLPEQSDEALDRLVWLLGEAEQSIRVGMFTWTHPRITDAVIGAARRGVKVEVALDCPQSKRVNLKSIEKMQNAPIEVRLNRGYEVFHHKFVWIDEKILISGSANWTRSAFGRNGECFLILHDLDNVQLKKMRRLWHIIRSTTRSSRYCER
ncbi:MAG: hypothetical protein K0U13_06770, partial [Chlamydiae bacterium]|nr:hypothetical protein [Chlamydiota bacterium]